MTVAIAAPAAAPEGAAAHDALLGTDGLPVWLNPDRFLLADFDPEACVTDLRRYVSVRSPSFASKHSAP